MYYFLSLLSGILLAVMIALNGGLALQYGLYWAAVFIHVTGLIFLVMLLLAKKEWPFAKRHAWYLYLGGIIATLNVLIHNIAFTRLSLSAMLALVLLGQSVMGLVIDHYGLLGMQKYPFRKEKLWSLSLILCGIWIMLTEFDLVMVALLLLAGAGIVLSRTINVRLSILTSREISAFFHFFVALLASVVLYFLFAEGETPLWGAVLSFRWYLYLGGVIGAAVIVINNFVAARIAAFYLALAIFIGQVLTGVLIDTVLTGAFSVRIFLGATLVASGLVANLFLDRRKETLRRS